MQTSEGTVAIPTIQDARLATPLNVDLPYLLGVLRRDWLFPVVGSLLGVLAALAYIAILPSHYKSSARILLDRSVNSYLQAKKVIDAPVLEDNAAASQVHIISSESIIIPVVRSMNLAHDPEFVGQGASDVGGSNWSWLSLIGYVNGLVRTKEGPPSEQMLERMAVETLLKQLTVYREDVPSVITITFASEDPVKAANIANAIAEKYLSANDDAKLKSTKLAGELLQERLNELKQQAADADRLLMNFMVANNLSAHRKLADVPDVIAGLTNQLSLSQAAIAEAKARLDVLSQQSLGDPNLSHVTDNTVVLGLHAQYLDLGVKEAELEKRVGDKHTAVLKMRSRREELKRAIVDERRRIAGSYASDYEVAKARKEEISSDLARLVAGVGGNDTQARVTMRELESSSEMLRKSYDIVLQRMNELNSSNDVVGPDARIITRAAPPLRKAPRKAALVLGGSVMLGFMLGLGLAFGRELASDVIRTQGQAKSLIDAYCMVLPRTSVPAGTREQSNGTGSRLEEYVLDAPFSRSAEAFRNIIAVLLAGREPGRGNVVCVVSSVPKEGKTTVTTNLGALMAVSSKTRVLVIDADLHRSSLTQKLTPHANVGLIEALDVPSQLSSFVVKMGRSGLDVLPCVTAHRPTNAAELIGSPEMEALIERARDLYDVILLEAPPIISVADVKMLEHQVDQFVMVIEWGATKRRLVQEALDEVEGIRERLACVVLNKVDPAFLKNLETYKGPNFREYYDG